MDVSMKHIKNTSVLPPTKFVEAPLTTHEFFYKSQFHIAYKTDERIMIDLVYNNVNCTNGNENQN